MNTEAAGHQTPYLPDASQPGSAPDNGSRAVAPARRPAGLEGVAIPSKDRQIRRKVEELYRLAPWLGPQDVGAVTVRAQVWRHLRRLSEEVMARLGLGAYLRQDGEPRKILSEFRALAMVLLRYDEALGLTPGSRLGLGIDTARMRGLMAKGEPEDDEGVIALEHRILTRLRSDREGHGNGD